MTTVELSASAHLAVAKHGVRVILVDYLQIMGDRVEGDDSIYARVSHASGALRVLAGTLNVCIVAATQMSRKYSNRDDPMPRLADAKGAGEIEQDCFWMLGLWREKDGSEAQVKVLKNRNGPNNIAIPMTFDARYARFHGSVVVEKKREK